MDAITGLQAPTYFGRPNWDGIYREVRWVDAGAGVHCLVLTSAGVVIAPPPTPPFSPLSILCIRHPVIAC